jgi:hypothetical protein
MRALMGCDLNGLNEGEWIGLIEGAPEGGPDPLNADAHRGAMNSA